METETILNISQVNIRESISHGKKLYGKKELKIMTIKRVFLKITVILTTLSLITGCQKAPENPKLAEDPEHFYDAWDEAAFANIDTTSLQDKLSTTFPESLNMNEYSGLVNPEDFTGPFLCYAGKSDDWAMNYIYVPNQDSWQYERDPILPDPVEWIQYASAANRIPEEYLSDEKLEQLQNKQLPIVFAVVECLGYSGSRIYYYPSGEKVTVNWLDWRVSFYSYPECELLGWESAIRPYSHPSVMSLQGSHPDENGNHVHINDDKGRRVDVLDVTMKLLYGESYGQTEVPEQPEQSEDGLSKYTYDDEGNLKREDIYDENGELKEYIEYSYHSLGFLLEKEGFDPAGTILWKTLFRANGQKRTHTTYHSNGQYDTVIEYNERGNVESEVHYDDKGNLID